MALINGSFDSANSPDTNMYDMGWVSDTDTDTDTACPEPVSMNNSKTKKYPSIYLDKVPDGLLSNIKVGEVVKFTATGMIKRISIDTDNEGKTINTALEIHSISQFKSDK